MKSKKMAQHYLLRIQSNKTCIRHEDVFFKNEDDFYFFKDGSVLKKNLDNFELMESSPIIHLSFTQDKDKKLFIKIKMDREGKDLNEDIPETQRLLYFNFNDDYGFTKTYFDDETEVTKREISDFFELLKIDQELLRKSFKLKENSDKELKSVILNCLSRKNEKSLTLENNRRKGNKP